jgi:DNA-directed RNA polymerase specialized sigma24 family protein
MTYKNDPFYAAFKNDPSFEKGVAQKLAKMKEALAKLTPQQRAAFLKKAR